MIAIGTILGLVESPTVKALAYVGGTLSIIVILIVVSVGAFNSFRNSIQASDLAKFNETQLQQSLTQQKAFTNQMQQLQDLQAQILAGITPDPSTKPAEVFVEAPETAKGDRAASDILKETVRRLGGQK